MKYIDLSHPFQERMPVYPGDPAASLTQVACIEQDGYTNHLIHTGMHVGTHMDAPLHMIAGGKKISDYAIDHFFGRGQLIDAREKPLNTDLLKGQDIQAGDILLFWTACAENYGQPDYYTNFPRMTEDLAWQIVELGVKIVGLDTPGPDDSPHPIHKILLGHDVLLIENLVHLEQLAGHPAFSVVALPAKWVADAAPVRVVAKLD